MTLLLLMFKCRYVGENTDHNLHTVLWDGRSKLPWQKAVNLVNEG